MKKIMILTCVILLGGAGIGYPCELIVRVPMGNTYLPFFEQGPDGKWSGLSIETAEALVKEAGCQPVYKSLPFPRALEDIKKGKIHLMLNLTATDERAEFTHFIGPQLDETVVLVVRKDAVPNIGSLEDLKLLPKSIGIERGKVYGKAFEEKRKMDAEFRKKLEEVTDVNLLELMLGKRRISGFLGYGYNVFYRLKTDPAYSDFTVHPYPINQDWVYYGFSKQAVSADLLKRLQSAYDRLTKKGVLEEIRQRYR